MHPATRWSQLVAVGNEAANARVFLFILSGRWWLARRPPHYWIWCPVASSKGQSLTHTYTPTHRHTHTTRTKRTKSNLPQELLIEVQMDSASSPMNPLWLCPVERLQKRRRKRVISSALSSSADHSFSTFFFFLPRPNKTRRH